MTTVSEYDVAIIGGGPGGYVAGIRAPVKLGLKSASLSEKRWARCLN